MATPAKTHKDAGRGGSGVKTHVKTQRTFLIALVLTLALTVLMLIIGCRAPRPGELCGWWKEVGYERHFLFASEGDFEFEEPEYTTVGEGTWTVEENEVSIELSSGHMNWAGHTAAAPATLVFEYSLSGGRIVSEGTLTLTRVGDAEPVTYRFAGSK